LREHRGSVDRRPTSTAPRITYVSRDAKPAFAAPRKQGHSMQRRVAAFLAVFLVPGIFVTTSIPAWAFDSDTTDQTALVAPDAQSVTTLAEGDTTDISRSDFDATTSEELAAKKLAAKLAAQQAAYASSAASASDGDYSVVGPRAPGDDYPWRTSYGLSPLAYVTRQCTDFVAWRLNRDAGVTHGPWKYVWSNMTPGHGNASAWAAAWRNNGWKTSNTPVPGAVAWFNGNHVAYVKSVDGGNVALEEYNWGGSRSYHTRTISASAVALFLYPPPR
jgi:surface antigen